MRGRRMMHPLAVYPSDSAWDIVIGMSEPIAEFFIPDMDWPEAPATSLFPTPTNREELDAQVEVIQSNMDLLRRELELRDRDREAIIAQEEQAEQARQAQ